LLPLQSYPDMLITVTVELYPLPTACRPLMTSGITKMNNNGR
jgi:hypothetical protein